MLTVPAALLQVQCVLKLRRMWGRRAVWFMNFCGRLFSDQTKEK